MDMLAIYLGAAGAAGTAAYALSRIYFDALAKSNRVSDGSLKEYLAPLGEFLASRAKRSPSIAEMASRYDSALLHSGRFWGGLNAFEILAAKFVFPTFLCSFIMFSGALLGFPIEIVALFALFFLVMGYMYPDTALDSQLKQRQALFMRQLPGGLDIIKVAADSGLDFHSSVSYLVDIYIPGPFKEEMRIFQRELKLGIPATTALMNIAHRVDVPEATTVFVALSQSIEMGTSIVAMLEDTTKEMRRKRLLSAQSEAQRAVVKITFPLLLLILPGIFIVLLAPVLQPMLKLFGNFAQ